MGLLRGSHYCETVLESLKVSKNWYPRRITSHGGYNFKIFMGTGKGQIEVARGVRIGGQDGTSWPVLPPLAIGISSTSYSYLQH